MEKLTFRDIEAATAGFAAERVIGKGSHGRVYRGVLEDGTQVAVKKAAGDGAKLDNEMDILLSLRSKHVVNLVGACQEPGRRLLVMELMPNGSLENLLHNAGGPLEWPARAAMALQIALAVQALHEAAPQAIIHRDIKSANVLVDSQWNARLADFGLAVRESDGLKSSNGGRTRPAGTMGYIDPGYIVPGKLSKKTDIFSLGVLLLEMVSGRRAIDTGSEPASLVEWAVPLIEERRFRGICDSRVALPSSLRRVTRVMLQVAARCVSPDERTRPSIGEIVTELRGGLDRRCDSVWCLLRDRLTRKWRRKRGRRIIYGDERREFNQQL